MRSGTKIAAVAIALSLAVAGCDADDTHSTSAPRSLSRSDTNPLITELVPLALEAGTRNLGMWITNPARTTVVYELRGPEEVWAVDRRGVPWLVAASAGIDRIEFVGGDHLAISGQTNGRYQVMLAELDGTHVSVVAESARELRFISRSGSEVVYAEAGVDDVQLFARHLDSGATRKIGSHQQEYPDLFGLTAVGDHVVIQATDGDSTSLLAMSVQDGDVVELPQHDPEFHATLVGEAPNGHAIVTEGRKGGGYIYTVDLERAEKLTDLTMNAVSPMVRLEGTVVTFVDTNDQPRQIDLITGGESSRPPDNSSPPAPVVGLEENARLHAVLDNGNWLVAGYLIDGATYRAVWNFNEQFGGAVSDRDIPALSLFEYNPSTEDLWQISGPPTFAAAQTASGAGVGPSSLLGVELLDGFVVFSTGFSGAAYDIEHNLYASPIPSMVDG